MADACTAGNLEDMHIMVLHRDGITIPSLKLAIFVLTTWHLIDVVPVVCSDFP
jgi:hypothetical protein